MISAKEKSITFIDDAHALSLFLSKDAPAWLNRLRNTGISRFRQLGIPTTQDEEWKYTNVSGIGQRNFSLPKNKKLADVTKLQDYCDSSEISIVFVNGAFSREHSTLKDLPAGVAIMNLADAVKSEEKTIKALLAKYENEDVFTSLNKAFFRDGTYIKIADKAVIDKFIHIVHVTSELTRESILFPRSLLVLGKSSETQILESHIAFNDLDYFTDAVTDIFMAENAKLQYTKVQNESKAALHINTTRLWQERDSQSESFSLVTGAKLTRNNLSVVLNGEGASAVLNGLYAVSGQQHVDNHTAVDHKTPNCTSNQLYKGILDGNARAVFNGKIFVRKEAQKTNSYQLNKNLLLGTGCQVDTKPQLEIFADDVKCTHGATIGQLNEDEIFYLRSRGIAKPAAVKMLSRGYVNDTLVRIKNEAVRQKLERLLTKVFSVLQ